jgi:hypothetical protein
VFAFACPAQSLGTNIIHRSAGMANKNRPFLFPA